MSAVTVSKYGASLGDQLGPVLPHVRAAAVLIAERFGLTTMGGWRASARDMSGHPAGLAVDFPSSKTQGDAIAAFATANAAELGIRYVIWQQRIWYPGKDWAAMATRTGSGDVNHLRHVHISWNLAPPSAGVLDKLRTGLTSVTGAVTGAAGNLNPLADWPAQVTGVGVKIAAVLAGLGLVLLGANRLVAPAIEGAVTKTMEAVT